MPFIDRDQSGKITGAYAVQQHSEQEFVADNDSAYLAFANPTASIHDQLKAILLTLPDTVQAQFGEVAAAVDLAIQNGSPNVAVLEIEALTLPSELEPVRAQMLAVLNGG